MKIGIFEVTESISGVYFNIRKGLKSEQIVICMYCLEARPQCFDSMHATRLEVDRVLPVIFEFPAHLIKILERNPCPSVRPTLNTWGVDAFDFLADSSENIISHTAPDQEFSFRNGIQTSDLKVTLRDLKS